MGTLTVQTFADRLRSALRDEQAAVRRWSDTDIQQYVSDAQRSAVQLRPEINPKTTSVQLVAGTRQSIPSEAFSLLNVVRNMGAAGTTPGAAIRYADLDDFNADADWHTDTADAVVQNYLSDAKLDRRTFYVYPPQPSAPHYVEMQYSKIPAEIGTNSNVIELDDIYQPILWYYVLFRAYNKEVNTQGVSIDARAGAYYSAFVTELMGGQASEARLAPVFHTLESRDMPPPGPGAAT